MNENYWKGAEENESEDVESEEEYGYKEDDQEDSWEDDVESYEY